jgi:3'(2'), 5'-bisphosphate nucleotidase
MDVALARRIAGIAIAAGTQILACRGDVAVRAKTDASPLTAADLAANATIVDALRELTPETPILSEELPIPERLDGRFWAIDPLDGTREFLAGNGEYTVNIALVEDGVAVLGAVHAPALGVTYLAAAGGGAFTLDANGERPVRARTTPTPFTVVASRSHGDALVERFCEHLPPHAMLRRGSSLKLCMVADGSADCYPRFGPTSWWDTAAAQCVVEAAGGRVVALDGAPLRYAGTSVRNPSFVCTSDAAAPLVDAALHAMGPITRP